MTIVLSNFKNFILWLRQTVTAMLFLDKVPGNKLILAVRIIFFRSYKSKYYIKLNWPTTESFGFIDIDVFDVSAISSSDGGGARANIQN